MFLFIPIRASLISSIVAPSLHEFSFTILSCNSIELYSWSFIRDSIITEFVVYVADMSTNNCFLTSISDSISERGFSPLGIERFKATLCVVISSKRVFISEYLVDTSPDESIIFIVLSALAIALFSDSICLLRTSILPHTF